MCVDVALHKLERKPMDHSEDIIFDDFDEDEILDEIKSLTLTRNELLYLSDSVTLLMEHSSEQGRMHIPARQLAPSAGGPGPIDLIQAIGLGFIDFNDSKQTTTIKVTIADLYLLRECCQSFIKINDEYVGFNLLRKIYNLLLEDAILERRFINKITTGLNLDLNSQTNTDIVDKLIEKIVKEQADDNPNSTT